MHIVLDSCIFCQDFLLTGTHFTTLLRGLDVAGATLCVPEVVLDEVEHVYASQLHECLQKLHSAHRSLHRFLQRGIASEPHFDEDRLRKDYVDGLRFKLIEVGAEFIPYTDVDHRTMALHAMGRRRPFRESSGGVVGYRDYLVWKAVVRVASQFDGTVLLVSSNVRDFCDQEHGELSGDLLADLDVAGLSRESVVLVDGLATLNAEYILPHLEVACQIRDGLSDFLGADLAIVLTANCEEQLADRYWEASDFWDIGPLKTARIYSIEGARNIRVDDVWRLSDSELMANLVFDATCIASALVSAPDFRDMQECGWSALRPPVLVLESHETGALAFLRLRYQASIEASILIDAERKTIEGLHIESIKALARSGND